MPKKYHIKDQNYAQTAYCGMWKPFHLIYYEGWKTKPENQKCQKCLKKLNDNLEYFARVYESSN